MAESPATEAPSTDAPVEDAPAVTDTPTVETAPDSPVDVTSTEIPSDTTVTDTPAETPPMDTAPVDTISPDITEDNVTEPSVATPSQDSIDSIDGDETVTTSDDNLTDQILQDLEKQTKAQKPVQQKTEYVSPPDYEFRGRALVYNCTGKHWACVDGPSYKACEDNSSSVKYLNKKTECHPVNIYESNRGCEIMQNRMVSSTAKTDFCN